jgi:hypothetical protein
MEYLTADKLDGDGDDFDGVLTYGVSSVLILEGIPPRDMANQPVAIPSPCRCRACRKRFYVKDWKLEPQAETLEGLRQVKPATALESVRCAGGANGSKRLRLSAGEARFSARQT